MSTHIHNYYMYKYQQISTNRKYQQITKSITYHKTVGNHETYKNFNVSGNFAIYIYIYIYVYVYIYIYICINNIC